VAIWGGYGNKQLEELALPDEKGEHLGRKEKEKGRPSQPLARLSKKLRTAKGKKRYLLRVFKTEHTGFLGKWIGRKRKGGGCRSQRLKLYLAKISFLSQDGGGGGTSHGEVGRGRERGVEGTVSLSYFNPGRLKQQLRR